MNDEAPVGQRLHAVFSQLTNENMTASGAPLNSQVYQTIREALLLGVLGPGETMSVRAVAAAFDISPMPVREALGRLMIDGSLESLPNRAFRVPPTSARQFRELLLMRLRLETLAAEHAAIRVQPEQLIGLAAAFETLSTSERSKANITGYLAAHRNFHFDIYKMAEMPRLYNAIETLWLRIGPLFKGVSKIFDLREEHRYHADIFRAMELCDPKAVVIAVENDLTSAGRHTMQLLQEDEAAGLAGKSALR